MRRLRDLVHQFVCTRNSRCKMLLKGCVSSLDGWPNCQRESAGAMRGQEDAFLQTPAASARAMRMTVLPWVKPDVSAPKTRPPTCAQTSTPCAHHILPSLCSADARGWVKPDVSAPKTR